jgi:pSer/pThr/pTyr-binding forkhead associated (FHA) protein
MSVRVPHLPMCRFKDDQQVGEYALDTSRSSYTVGKQGDIKLKHQSCSRRHAEITLSHGPSGAVVRITDIGSTHGTFIDGKRLQGMKYVHFTAFKHIVY